MYFLVTTNNIIYNPVLFNRPCGAIKDNEKKEIRILVKNDLNHRFINLVSYSDEDESIFLKHNMHYVETIGEYSVYSTTLEGFSTGIYYYFFEIGFDNDLKTVSKIDGKSQISDHRVPWQLTVYDHNYSTPEWIKGGIMYQIFPDRFCKNKEFIPRKAVNEEERIIHTNWYDTPDSPLDTQHYSAKDFFMGNLNGIWDMADYLEDLNVDLLYLNPIFESAENHRYSTSDYFEIDPYLGDVETFEKICSDFKKKNIGIILDGVFSHTGSDSIYFNKYSRYPEVGAYNSMQSKYYPWYRFSEYPDSYDSWWGFDNLPTINKENEDYIDFVCQKDSGVLNFWQSKGISGWRFDVIDELPDVFIDEMRTSIKSYDKESLMIGEVWEDASNKIAYGFRRRYLLGAQMDSVMNYPWRNSIVHFVKSKDAHGFAQSITEIINNYPAPSLDTLMNLLSTHDIERISTVLGVDISTIPYENTKDFILSEHQYDEASTLHKFASFIQFTLPGVPSIYYGDEIGMQGFKDPFNRKAFDYENMDKNLLKYYKSLTAFRNKYKDNFKTGFQMVEVGDMHIAYSRNNILCIVNFSDGPIIIDKSVKGNWIFGNKKPYLTDYGTVVGPLSYTAIKMTEPIEFSDSEIFKKTIKDVNR